MEQDQERQLRDHKLQPEGQWQDERNGSNGKSPIGLVGPTFFFLTLGLQDVEEGKTNYRAKAIEENEQKPQRAPNAQ